MGLSKVIAALFLFFVVFLGTTLWAFTGVVMDFSGNSYEEVEKVFGVPPWLLCSVWKSTLGVRCEGPLDPWLNLAAIALIVMTP